MDRCYALVLVQPGIPVRLIVLLKRLHEREPFKAIDLDAVRRLGVAVDAACMLLESVRVGALQATNAKWVPVLDCVLHRSRLQVRALSLTNFGRAGSLAPLRAHLVHRIINLLKQL